ncbi:hypothetical protein ACP4OV_027219 [Aristida adscensionis]
MQAAADDGSVSGAGRDWSRLPEDLLITVLRALHVPDAVRSGAVCTSWHAAYAAFRRLCVPSPRQPPCLLYACDALGSGAAALHCPSTGANLRIPFPLPPLARRPLLGSGHGWLVTADDASDLHLLNPLTGAQLALPPITALHHVEGSTDAQGNHLYNVYEMLPEHNPSTGRLEVDEEPTVLDAHRAHEFMYDRVVLSASPSAGGGRACVVLLLHMPHGEVSFARLGDERWTWVAPGGGDTDLPWRYDYCDAMYSDADGLFYLLRFDGAMVSLDLNGPSPVARRVLGSVPMSVNPAKYLVQTPAGDILQVWRRREYAGSLIRVEIPPDYEDDDPVENPNVVVNTTDLQLYKVDLQLQKVKRIKGLLDCALFLGLNGSLCLPVKDFPDLKPNCAYLTDDFLEYVNILKYNCRDVGVWSIAQRKMLSLVDVMYPWLNWPPPIWIKPSLF